MCFSLKIKGVEDMEQSKKVLLVNQDTEFRDYLTNFIPLLGNFEIEGAPHLIAGLAKTNAFKPELLIYNLDLAQARARDIFLAELKKKHPDTKMLVVVSSKDEKEKIKQIGMQHVLVKPFDLTDLSEEIKKLLPQKGGLESLEYAKLLIADDEPEISRFLDDSFKELGIEVHLAQDGLDALKIFKEHQCNLAIIDVKMPYMNGIQVVKEFSSSKYAPAPKEIILMTAGLGDNLTEFRRLGYMVAQKPLDMPAIEEKILQDCEKHHLTLRK